DKGRALEKAAPVRVRGQDLCYPIDQPPAHRAVPSSASRTDPTRPCERAGRTDGAATVVPPSTLGGRAPPGAPKGQPTPGNTSGHRTAQARHRWKLRVRATGHE